MTNRRNRANRPPELVSTEPTLLNKVEHDDLVSAASPSLTKPHSPLPASSPQSSYISTGSETLFANLLESAPGAIVVIDQTGIIQMVNARTEEMFGYNRAQLISQPVEILLPESLQTVHSQHRASYFSSPAQRSMGEGRDLAGRRCDGTEFPVEIGLSYVSNENGITGIAFIADITERKRAEEAVRERSKRFENLLDSAPGAIVVIDQVGLIQMVNPRTEELFGYARNQLVGQPVEILLPERFRAIHASHRNTYFDAPQQRLMGVGRDLAGLRMDGTEFPIEIGLSYVSDDESVLGIAFIADITERKRAEEAVRERSKRFENLLESAPGAVVVIDHSGLIQMVNPRTEDLFGYARNELVGQQVEVLLPQRFRASHAHHRTTYFDAPQQRLMGEGRDLAGLRKDGTEFPIEIGLSYVNDEEGVLGIAFIADITERQQAEEAVRERSERFENLLESAPGAIVVIDHSGRIEMVNSRTEALFDYSRDELIGQPVEMLLPERFRSGHGKYRETYFANPQQRPMGVGRDLAGLRKDGTEFPVEIGLSSASDDEGVVGIAFIADITERKRADELLRESEERFRFIFERSTIAKSLTAPDGRLLQVNQAFADLVGYSIEEMEQLDFTNISHPGELEKTQEYIRSLLVNERQTARFEKRYIHRNGSSIWADVSTTLMRDQEGNPLYFLTSINDITERKRAEQELEASKERLQSTLDNLMEGCQIIGTDWRYLYLNDAAIVQSHKTRDELLGHTMMEIYPGIEGTPLFALLTRCMEEQVAEHMLNEFAYPDGTKGWYALSIQPVPEGIFILSSDITNQKEAEEVVRRLNTELEQRVIERTARLQESEEKFSKAFRVSPTGVAISRLADGRIIDVNEAYSRIIGWSPEELIGHSSNELGLFDPDQRAELVQMMISEGSVSNLELELRTKSNQLVTVLGFVEQIELNGEPCVLSVIYDVTELKRKEIEVRRLNQDLEQRQVALEAANHELEAFSYSVSHDLRAPLRSLSGFSKILLEKFSAGLDPQALRYLEYLNADARQMGTLIDDLLAFSRLGRQALQKQRVRPIDLVNDVLDDYREEIEQRNIKIKLGDLPGCQADPSLLKQVYVNLISNAIKFTGKTTEAEIEIGSEQANNEQIYYVKDNGAGFDMAYADKLFGVFQRLHLPEDFEGTGVGLAIVQRIVHRHGGRIWADSKPDEGAAFYFTLQGESEDV